MRVIIGGVWGDVGAQQGREHPGCTRCLHAQPSQAGRHAWRKARRRCQPLGTAGWGPPGGLGGISSPIAAVDGATAPLVPPPVLLLQQEPHCQTHP